jgi:hypothetical protein
MRGIITAAVRVALALVLAASGVGSARAIDLLPFDYVSVPAGTTAVLGYYLFGTRSSLNSTIAGDFSSGTGLDTHIGAVRITRYGELFEHPAAMQLIVVGGALSDGRVAGAPLAEPTGFADPLLTLAFWPISDPKARRWLAIANYTTFPVGNYQPGRTLNLGGNRFQNDLQIGFLQGLPGGFTLDVAFDWIWYGDNDRAGAGTQRLSQQSTFETFAWLVHNFTEANWAAVGWYGSYGGTQQLDGTRNGLKTSFHQLRAAYGQFVTPSLQLVGQVARDIDVTGGFQQDFAMTLRVLKVF